MGIKTLISPTQLPNRYQQYTLTPTQDGVRDSVYLLGDAFVVKYFESADTQCIESEASLLKHLGTLPVPKLLTYFYIGNNLCTIYTQIKGKSPYTPTLIQIEQIGAFLQRFHQKTIGATHTNPKLFESSRVKKLVEQTGYAPLQTIFESLELRLENHGIIHGDLFVDNAKYIDGRLSGVYDFSEACEGDFLFDLAVVAVSWCFEEEMLHTLKLHTLLQSYDPSLNTTTIIPYLKYALLYYATTRYAQGHDYKTLLKRYEGLQ